MLILVCTLLIFLKFFFIRQYGAKDHFRYHVWLKSNFRHVITELILINTDFEFWLKMDFNYIWYLIWYLLFIVRSPTLLPFTVRKFACFYILVRSKICFTCYKLTVFSVPNNIGLRLSIRYFTRQLNLLVFTDFHPTSRWMINNFNSIWWHWKEE